MTEERTCRCMGQFAMHKPSVHADRDGSERRRSMEREHERGLAADVAEPGHYPDAIGSLVNAAKAEGKAQRTIADLRAEVERLAKGWRSVTSALGYGDGITEPQIDFENFIRLMQETARDADEWRESQLWRGDCYEAGHPDDQDCFEHDPSLRMEKAEAALARVEALAESSSPCCNYREALDRPCLELEYEDLAYWIGKPEPHEDADGFLIGWNGSHDAADWTPIEEDK